MQFGLNILTNEEEKATLLQISQVEKPVWILDHEETLFVLLQHHAETIAPGSRLTHIKEAFLIDVFVIGTTSSASVHVIIVYVVLAVEHEVFLLLPHICILSIDE